MKDDVDGLTSPFVSVTVGPFGAVAPTPASLTFDDVGAGSAKTFKVSESGYSGSFSVDATACSGVATVGPASGDASTTFTVTPVGAGGPCSISVTDDHTQNAVVSATVGPFGTIAPTPTSLAFSDVGSGANKTFTVSESGYGGSFTVDGSACAGIATVSPASGDSTTTFSVTPVAGGGPCNVSITDDHATPAATVAVTVGPFGAVTPAPTSLTFSDVGAGAAQTFSVSESGYTGNFSIDASACSGVATASPPSGPAGTFTVTPVGGGGPCNITVSDDHGQNASVSITVGPFGSIVPSPTSFSFDVGGPSATFTVSETGYTGAFTVDGSTCASNDVASVSPSSGTSATTFTVTPGSSPGNCNISISDDHGGTQPLLVSLAAGGMTVSQATLFFTDTDAGPQDRHRVRTWIDDAPLHQRGTSTSRTWFRTTALARAPRSSRSHPATRPARHRSRSLTTSGARWS